MKQRDAAISARGDGAKGPYNKGSAAETGTSQSGGADSSAAAAATVAAAQQQQQQRIRGLEEKVADLEAKLEHALAEKDRFEWRVQNMVMRVPCF